MHVPYPSNVPGDFYVEEGCCTLCEVPLAEVPDLFGVAETPYTHCYVKRQPQTPSELGRMIRTVHAADLRCIRYRGTDRRIQLQLIEENDDVCDELPNDLRQQVERRRRAKHRPWWKFW